MGSNITTKLLQNASLTHAESVYFFQGLEMEKLESKPFWRNIFLRYQTWEIDKMHSMFILNGMRILEFQKHFTSKTLCNLSFFL